MTSRRKKTQPRQNVVDSRENSQTHDNIKANHDKTNSTHAKINFNSRRSEKDIFKNSNGESLKQEIL